MKFPLRFVLILTAVIAAAFLVLAVACGGDEEEEGPAAGETPAAAETPEETPAGEVGELPSIPAYPGAEEVSSGTFTGAGAFPIPLTGDIPIGPEEFAEVRYTFYETSDSSDKVSDFYEKEFKDWKEEWAFSMEELGQKGEVVVWSKDDQNIAAWMTAFEEDGTTTVVVAIGGRQ
jgi:hypothetical protein